MIWIEKGELIADGLTDDVLAEYAKTESGLGGAGRVRPESAVAGLRARDQNPGRGRPAHEVPDRPDRVTARPDDTSRTSLNGVAG